jgi:hypothetical protein
VTFELLETEEEEEDDEDQDDDIEIEKYSEYIEKHCTESNDQVVIDQLKPRLVTRPIFLTRNAHVLKCKLGVYTKNTTTPTENEANPAADAVKSESETVKEESAEEKVVKEKESVVQGSIRPKTNETTVKYRRNSFKKARKSHLTVTKRMYDKFRKLNNKWLKEHSKTADCIDDWLLGDMAGPATKTVCIKESQLKKVPYHVFYRYRVMPANPKQAETAPVANKKNGAVGGKKADETVAESGNKPSAVDSKTNAAAASTA